MTSAVRRRSRTAVVLAAVLVAGVLVARTVPDPAGDIGGDVVYAVAAYTGLVLLFPRLRPATAGALATGWCWAVEALQATGASAALADRVPAAAWVLGTGFSWRDLASYAAGAGLAWALDPARRGPAPGKRGLDRARRRPVAAAAPPAATSGAAARTAAPRGTPARREVTPKPPR